jgi:hypothetical protein
VQGRAGEPATRVLVLAEKGAAAGQLVIDAPLVERVGDARSAELLRICGEPATAGARRSR